MCLYQGTNDPQNCVYRVAYLSFKISINFTLLKYLKVDERNKILNFSKWFWDIASKLTKSLCIKTQAGEGEKWPKLSLFHSIVVGMGAFKVGSWNFQTPTLSSKSFLYLE